MPTDTKTLVVMEGDETGQELLEEALRVIEPSVIGSEIALARYDLSLKNRRATRNGVVDEAAAAMKEYGFGLKAATITPEEAGDVGSPNAILRAGIDGKVIIRTGRRLAGVRPVGGIHAPISVVRMAVDDAYGAEEGRIGTGDDEIAWRREQITRRTCRAVAEIAFLQAQRMRAMVTGGPKWTVSPVYEGMLKEELDAAAQRHPSVKYRPMLIDATYAMLIAHAGDALVVPALNRDGDLLSDMVLQLFGSIAGAESLLFALDEEYRPTVVMAEAPHGTAPTLLGKNVANPLAMILASAAVLSYMDEPLAARAIYEAALETVGDGVKTMDLGGFSHTDEFTDEVIKRVRTKLDVWEAIGDSALELARRRPMPDSGETFEIRDSDRSEA